MSKMDPAVECRTIPLWPDAARVLGIGRNLAFEGAATGKIPTIRIGRKIRVPIARLNEMLGEHAADTVVR